MKVVDPEQRVSYVTPTSTEGLYGGQWVCNKAHSVSFVLTVVIPWIFCCVIKDNVNKKE